MTAAQRNTIRRACDAVARAKLDAAGGYDAVEAAIRAAEVEAATVTPHGHAARLHAERMR